MGESKLQRSEMVYNSEYPVETMSGFCEVTQYNFHCTGTGQCAGGSCDMCSLCVDESVYYVYCGGSSGGGSSGGGNDETIVAGGGAGGGVGEYDGIYIPNPYEGEENLNNEQFVFATQVAAFTRTLPPNLKNLLVNNFWFYPNIVDFMRNNGGLTQENKDAVILSNIESIFNTISQSSSNLTSTEINHLKYKIFISLLQNPTPESVVFIEELLNEFFLNLHPVYDEDDFPGKNLNFPFEWWKDDEFIRNNLLVSFEVPNIFELLAFNMFPAYSLLHIENSTTALDEANSLTINNPTTFPPSGIEDGKADAFRHAYWNVLDSAEFGPNITKIFTNAHEAFSSGLPKTMDLYNNQKGR